ncbi:MAG: MAPEG family protein [Sphingomicrobium sp.]
MTIAEWCLFAAAILPLITLAPLKAAAGREFDNSNPRNPTFYDRPMRSRLFGAHLNGFEVFPFFATAILLAEFRHSPQGWIDGLATAFVLVRAAFVGAYVFDRPTLRTALWNMGFALNLGIFFCSGFGVSGAVIATSIGLAFALGVALLLALVAPRH